MAPWISNITKTRRQPRPALGQDWTSIPFQRMPNVSLQPNARELTEDDVIGATKRGIYIEGDGSFSIDQQRYNFQFGGQAFWEIRDGKRTRMLRDVGLSGAHARFLEFAGARRRPSDLPARRGVQRRQRSAEQVNAVSHGCPIALFRNVNVINTA